MENFGSLVIIGAIVSALVQAIKNRFGTSGSITIAIVAGLLLVCGVAYYFFQRSGLVESVITILGFAGATYTYIFKRFEE